MGPKLFECNGFSAHPITPQADRFALALSARNWAKFDAAMEYLTRCLCVGAPVVGRAEKVSGATHKLYELKITTPGSKGPQLRMLCTVEGDRILCVRGVDKRQPKLRPEDVRAADKALRDYAGKKHERPPGKGKRKGSR
ncbi:MAG: hypothetical protein WA687_12735 [Solirubrobacterales bacterium]